MRFCRTQLFDYYYYYCRTLRHTITRFHLLSSHKLELPLLIGTPLKSESADNWIDRFNAILFLTPLHVIFHQDMIFYSFECLFQLLQAYKRQRERGDRSSSPTEKDFTTQAVLRFTTKNRNLQTLQKVRTVINHCLITCSIS